MPEQKGKVYLVGAGPGDIAYLTVQAYHLITQAEVIVHDALVDEQLLGLIPATCQRVDVGKRGGHPSPRQESIDRLLVDYCQQGKQVVRLKSGDPFIFGRCRSEIVALQTAGCAFEVVPGLSSALAAPLLAGIPLTDPQLSQGFVVFSAHELESLDWSTLAQIDTLVVLMGGRHLTEIMQQLQQQGRSPQTPVAVIRWGGHRQQQIWRGTLKNIAEKTAGALSPAVIVVGAVGQLSLQANDKRQQQVFNPPLQYQPEQAMTSDQPVPNEKANFLARPLASKTIVVTRAAGQSSSFSSQLQQAGANVVEMPALEIGPPSSWLALDQAIAELQTFDWLILTSVNCVNYFVERLVAQGKDARALAGVQIAVVGKKTAANLRQKGLTADFIPPDFVADALVEFFPEKDLTGTKILFPRVETGGRDTLVTGLTAKGAEVVEVPAYESRCPRKIAPSALDAIREQQVDVITFASSKTVQNFCQLLEQAEAVTNSLETLTGENWQFLLSDVCVASIGPQTSEACRSLLGRVDVEAEEYTLEGLKAAIVSHYMAELLEV
ncbi:Uroporphyrinogen-III methyltransferase / Uroporphyrinogen-III synthase [uncultured Synechococcales cyanobacterium]|uniref:uroporphyrinogen-III C-methyltransferase n=1 Tax=uncultured Synechococcales cyanobacterium TaxID=1936017 RepID=A0A6J4VBW0_9CYAN|nr:Uroporphyrinogen-III methyltransferase / Uroporphyrinogen-III synthase [uncultured Synechococcales cyanobacterium]